MGRVTYIPTEAGCSVESAEAIEQVKEILAENGVEYPEVYAKADSRWLFQLLSKYIQIKYIRVVLSKPDDGIIISKRKYLECYLAKRMTPNRMSKCPMIFLYPLYPRRRTKR